MKLYKFLAVALVGLAFTSCEDGKDVTAPSAPKYNSASGVVVSMQNDEMQFSEDQQGNAMCKIPVVVTGDANGAVSVTVKVAEVASSPAVEGENFVITSKTIIIPKGSMVGNIEFYPIGDDIENENREFTVTIDKVVGATVGAYTTTLVRLRDNESFIPVAYQAVQGIWNCAVSDEGDVEEGIVEIVGVAEGEPGFNSELTMYGWLSWTGIETEVKCKISCDGVTGAPILEIPRGQVIGETYVRLSADGAPVLVDLVMASATSNYVFSGNFAIPANEDVTEMYLEEPFLTCAYLNGANIGYLLWYDDIKLTRAQ